MQIMFFLHFVSSMFKLLKLPETLSFINNRLQRKYVTSLNSFFHASSQRLIREHITVHVSNVRIEGTINVFIKLMFA